LAHHSLVEWDKEAIFLVVCSTAGDGDPPVDARDFFNNVPTDLKHVNFAVLAPGDSAYPHFCEAGRQLGKLLEARGAKPMMPVRDLDGDNSGYVNAWIATALEMVIVRRSRLRDWALKGSFLVGFDVVSFGKKCDGLYIDLDISLFLRHKGRQGRLPARQCQAEWRTLVKRRARHS